MVAANVCAETPSANGSEVERPFSDGSNRFLEALERAKKKQIEEKSQKLAQEAQDADKKSAQEAQQELQQAAKSASSDWESYKPYAISAGAAATTLGLVGFMATKVAALAAITGPQIALIPLVAVAAGAWNFWHEKDKPVLELSPKNAKLFNSNKKLEQVAFDSNAKMKIDAAIAFDTKAANIVPTISFGNIYGEDNLQRAVAGHEIAKQTVAYGALMLDKASARQKTNYELVKDYIIPAGATGLLGCLMLSAGAFNPVGGCFLLIGLGYAAVTDNTNENSLINDGSKNTVDRTLTFFKQGVYALVGNAVFDGRVKKHMVDLGKAFHPNINLHEHNNRIFVSSEEIGVVRERMQRVGLEQGQTAAERAAGEASAAGSVSS